MTRRRGHTMRGGTATFRRAVAASVGLHVLLAVVVAVGVRWNARRPVPPQPPALDTRVDLRIAFAPEEASAPVDVPAPSLEPASPTAVQPPAPEPPEDTRPPLARTVTIPQTLPPELLDRLKRLPAPVADVVEVAVTPTPQHPQPAPPSPAPAPAPVSTPPPTVVRAAAATWVDGGTPIHGALPAGKTIVYVLDTSGSMGEWGKFDAARRALVASLRAQPESVRFQVVVYAATALVPLPAPESGCVPATARDVARMADVLRALPDPAGRSNHAAGLREALALRPDFVLILTDADDLPAATFRELLRRAVKPAVVCVAKVGANGVGPAVEVK